MKGVCFPMTGNTDIFQYFHHSTGGRLICLAVIIVCLILCFFFSLMGCAAGAAGALKHTDDNDTNTRHALKIKNNTEKYILCARTGFALYFAAMIITACLAYISPIQKLLESVQVSPLSAGILAFAIVFAAVCIMGITFGQCLPAKLASVAPENTLVRHSRSFLILSAAAMPFAAVCSLIAGSIVRMSGLHNDADRKNKTEEKILMMVGQGEENGMIEENTKSMIENVFDFDDTTVGEIMTHRKDVIAAEDNACIADLTETAIASGRSRIPVYHDDIDNIVGIIYVKDLLKFVGRNAPRESIGKDMIHEAVFVPESKRCSEMFKYMTLHKTQIAVVVDEFGGTGGIITMEDLIESILGNIQDEYDNEEEEIKKVNEYSFKVDGATSLDEISTLTNINFDDEENDTIAGIMLDRMGHIPKNGEHPSVVIDGTRFTVLEVDGRRISKILVVKKTGNSATKNATKYSRN